MRDARGRFAQGNPFAAQGGRARAANLSPARRRQIARAGYARLVEKHFAGDHGAQRAYFAALGRWNYERMADVDVALGGSVRRATRHPGRPTDFLAVFWQPSLLDPLLAEANFYR